MHHPLQLQDLQEFVRRLNMSALTRQKEKYPCETDLEPPQYMILALGPLLLPSLTPEILRALDSPGNLKFPLILLYSDGAMPSDLDRSCAF